MEREDVKAVRTGGGGEGSLLLAYMGQTLFSGIGSWATELHSLGDSSFLG